MKTDFSKSEYDAIVIGSGPNGLACAIELARNNLSVVVVERSDIPGGGMKTLELTEPGFMHDLCSAVHPLAYASPFFKTLPLEKHGLKWLHSPAEVAHPFDDGTVTLLHRSIQDTAKQFSLDQSAYKKLFEPLHARWERLVEEILAPPFHFPRHPLLLARFGLKAITSADGFAIRNFKDEKARALFMGIAAHSCSSLTGAASSAVGLTLQLAGHGGGWPIPEGGAQNICRALVSYFESLGGEVVMGLEVKEVGSLPKSKRVFFDLTPKQILRIAGKSLPASIHSSFERYQYGPGVFKLDWALNAPIPWKNPETARAGTVHLGNSSQEIIHSEACVNEGSVSRRPFILLSQPTLFDHTRAPAGKHIAWAYCHVPHASTLDMTAIVEDQIERFAPGFKDTIIRRSSLSPRELEERNPNLVGGDISGGLVNARQLFFRPKFAVDPYRLDGKKYWICSSSTPPGPAVHGMCGFNAARAALRH